MTLPAYALNAQSFPERYEQALVQPLFRPFAEALVEQVGVAAGQRILDVACGTGIVARLAAERAGSTGRVVGLDVSREMLAVAARVAPNVEWRDGTAAALPFGDGEFDAVLCHQGLQFFPDRAAAMHEMRRVLTAGGRLGVATWVPLEDVPFFRDMHRVGERHAGPISDQRHAFGDGDALGALLGSAGFRNVRIARVTRTVTFENRDILQLNAMALVGMSTAGKSKSDNERAALVDLITRDSAEAAKGYTVGEGLAFALTSNIATAEV
jgi:ubiquinone/menaquinone biosynthesis C-methylase UbiE